MTINVTALPEVGAVVRGFRIDETYNDAIKRELVDAWNEYGLLVLHEQPVTPEHQIRFSRIFGDLAEHPLKTTRSEEHPELFVLRNGGTADRFVTASYNGVQVVGRLDWHVDLHYTGKPNRGAALTAIVVPTRDGLTGFGDLNKAYEALDGDTKRLLSGIEVAYTFSMQRMHMRFVDHRGYEAGAGSPRKPSDMGFPDFPDVAYPAVITHPITGRHVLGIVEQFLDRVVSPQRHGLSNDESIELLERVLVHVRQERFTYFHHWSPGDLVLWDNWRYMHCATGTPVGVSRVINRTTILGDRALGRVIDV